MTQNRIPQGLALTALVASLLTPLSAKAEQEFNADLHARLPQAIRDAGEMVAVNNGSFPPYEIVEGTDLTGATADLSAAISEIIGVEIHHASVAGLSALLSGISADRYQFAMGPVGDFPSRREGNDFVNWVQEYVVFAVRAGNPEGIEGLETVCGKRIAVMSGGSAERVLLAQSEKCEADGDDAIDMQSYTDQPTSILAVRSNRADAFFSSQAPLTYFVQQSNGQLELTGVGLSNGFPNLFQGAVVPKDSELGPVLLDAVEILMENGTYAEIMTEWGLENNMITVPGMNLGEAL
ncbi:polar amino acid transport system substrate-binding protein [Monaibacterium marinum]|uniref:Polar amino acid transport system substrate-binding protein n=1 Tax=Pontivivens marinum TaxID=1690039 RepID=A0A2C9CRP4_9RHOB|nr:ABC transporter substrate-binding protein [Monaibacterium marinum]SOH93902.1 polar amino acid transport system substrate-binding protein [Monaibacterium marinum]